MNRKNQVSIRLQKISAVVIVVALGLEYFFIFATTPPEKREGLAWIFLIAFAFFVLAGIVVKNSKRK